MNISTWTDELEHIDASTLFLATLAGLALAAGVLYQIGVIGWVLGGLGSVVRGIIRGGFRLWERLLAWASWPRFLALVVGFLVLGWVAGGPLPGLRVMCGLAPLVMGAIACLAYMFIDQERYEVERGHMAFHQPLKGQELARHLARYGQQVRDSLLISATVALIGGFALFNQGLYETIGRDWYRVTAETGEPGTADFLVYVLTNLLGIVDVLDLAVTRRWVQAAAVHHAEWPASSLLVGFKMFFSLVLVHQIFASLRQGRLLAEAITDFWSPHEPIHDRARNALAQFGGRVIEPLLVSLRSVPSLTKEQRDQLPQILATLGPSTIPALARHLNDPREHVRAIAAAALGQLRAVDTVPLLAGLGQDPSDVVRQSVVEAMGILCGSGDGDARKQRGLGLGRSRGLKEPRIRWWFGRKARGAPAAYQDPVELAVSCLESALGDDSAAVRTQAARALGRIGPPAVAVTPGLIGLLKDIDETVRCQAAEALGQVGGDDGATVGALAELLHDASAPVKAAAALALGALKAEAAPAVAALVPLLQDREDSVRTAAAEAISQVGPLSEAATDTLVEGLASPDTVVRAQTAEALGTIGAAAGEAAAALVETMADDSDRVRAKSVEALGKIGESAGVAAVPGLVRALRDPDNWVTALAAEALGQMGKSADAAIPALVRSLRHPNPLVRSNAAEALGKLGEAAIAARPALETAALDEDGGVRSEAIRALGVIGSATPASLQVALAGLRDADPLVRAAAVESVGLWGELSEAVLGALLPVLEDANDQVKVEATRVLPRLAGATPAVIDGLCRRLLEDDSAWVQVHAALALGRLGPAAAAAGGALLRAAQIGDVDVREQALRAIAMIQPPETMEALAAGLKDASGDIRMVASASWMNAEAIPEAVIPALVEALRDPEPQVRANAAHSLARLDPLPAEAIPLLIECTTDAHDGLRMNATMALNRAPAAGAVAEVMRHLVADPNSRVRLIAASFLLTAELGNAEASVVVVEALGDPALRVRKAAVELVEALGPAGVGFLDTLKLLNGLGVEADLRITLVRLIERLEALPKPETQPVGPQE